MQDGQRERMERAAEKERERELERETVLESRRESASLSAFGKPARRFSTIPEANGQLSAPNSMMLPPIQPVSPLMKAEQKII